MDDHFWQGKRVFLTGHTGFKGMWLAMWLHSLGAKVAGYALHPPAGPSLFELCKATEWMTFIIGDIRDQAHLNEALQSADPEIVIHMAAQALVLPSHADPVNTYEVNVLGTVYLLEAVRAWAAAGGGVKAILNVTSDKCYENREWIWGYRENDSLLGRDPYSNSKACSELVTACYRATYFPPELGVAVASARAGNVIGGGDFAANRLVPDCIRALLQGEPIKIRNPESTRPWQHVLEPISGYLMLARRLYESGAEFAGAWNFGPNDDEVRSVEWIAQSICAKWGNGATYKQDVPSMFHEARYLKLDCAKAKAELGWRPRWTIDEALDKVIEWVAAFLGNGGMRTFCLRQIAEYSVDRKA